MMLAICAALRWEIRPILPSLGRIERIRRGGVTFWRAIGGAPVLVFETGIGVQRARHAATVAADAFPLAAILNTGCAGSLVPHLEAGAAVVPDVLVQDGSPPRRYEMAPRLAALVREAAHSLGAETLRGAVLTSPAPLMTREEKNAAKARSGAVAVEMEGCSVAAVAAERGLPCASARIILDVLDADLSGSAVRRGSNTFSNSLRIMAQALSSPTDLANLPPPIRGAVEVHRGLRGLFSQLLKDRSAREEWFDHSV
jgi:adenosylhomocysteine nucleosidase